MQKACYGRDIGDPMPLEEIDTRLAMAELGSGPMETAGEKEDSGVKRTCQSLFLVCLAAGILILPLSACKKRHELEVTASAYNSLHAQTQGDPNVTAWGDRLEPGDRAIAVSRDLIPLGLTHGVEVEIQGFPGTYRVMDKMNRRWKMKIDIYMGDDIEAARAWGKRKVSIFWYE